MIGIRRPLNPPEGISIAQARSQAALMGQITVEYTSISQCQGAGVNVAMGARRPPAWQADPTLGKMAPPIPGGLQYQCVLLIPAAGVPTPMTEAQKATERRQLPMP